MVSREDVLAAYRLILGRDGTEGEVAAHTHAPDLAALRAVFLHSLEFRSVISDLPCPIPFPAFIDRAAPIRVDCKADEETMRRLLLRVERCWEEQARTEPFWSVCSQDRFKQECFAANAEEFYANGEHDAIRLALWLDRNGVDASRFESCLELGCGVGRVTPWLARRFQRVFACDISMEHIQMAAARIEQQGLENVDFLLTSSMETFSLLPAVDVVLSIIVLQHNPPPIIHALLDRMFRLLNPGGVAFFQVPTYAEGYQFDVEAYLNGPDHSDIEMHLIPQRTVFELAESNNCSVLEVEPDLWVRNPGWLSNTFVVSKRRSRAVRRPSQ